VYLLFFAKGCNCDTSWQLVALSERCIIHLFIKFAAIPQKKMCIRLMLDWILQIFHPHHHSRAEEFVLTYIFRSIHTLPLGYRKLGFVKQA
jgi:hypothetical protein